MKGLIVTTDRELRLVDDIPEPEIGDYEALVKIRCCMICNGTDMGVIRHKVREADRYPAVLGHEDAGYVVRVGAKVTSYKAGDLVVRASQPDNEKYASAWGGFAEYAVVKDYAAAAKDGVRLKDASLGITQQVCPPKMRPEDASLLITLKETYSALDRIGSAGCGNMLIIGDGPVALAFLVCAKLQGAGKVYLFGNHREKLETAARLGADGVYLNKDPDEVRRAERELGRKMDFCIDTIGANPTMEQGLDYIHEDGTVAVYGLKSDEYINVRTPVLRNFSIRYIQWPLPEWEARAHEPVVRAVMDGKIDTDALITHRFPVEKYQKGIEAVRNRTALKVVLYFGEE
ncbi:MAG TPA: zinc-binding dehydrogenase [Candidatus Mediterraneibacter faecavium]|uniref:Zinc-binding dehydrogenase n=1 Tax=Candidatus Mediterraneibacter faecavium TaxID=2838668 RepID=A0A9D2Q8H3_9FIRM|nr:zinc-binding dehydrogenase [Candidatus Mediterraneibacter faecavium]